MKLSIIILLISFLICSCGGYNEGIIQKSEKGFLKFVGDIKTVTLVIDQGEAFLLDPKIEVYQVKPGKHTIKMYRNNNLIVNRNVIVDNQTTMEIEIP
jgi:hypothetical protein